MITTPRTAPPQLGPKVTAVIPVHNNASTILPLLDSLARQTIPPDEVVVVDDASKDETASLVLEHPLRVRLIRLEINSGPSMARNVGVEAAEGDVILFLDSDVEADPGCVAEVKSVFYDQSVDALNGMMHDQPLNNGWAVWYKCLVEHAWGDFMPQWDNTPNCLNARIGAIRRNMFLEVGGFDLRYKKPDVEDHHFGLCFTQTRRIVFDRNLKAFHHFSNFSQTAINYWKRTRSMLKLLWSFPHAKTDNSGASQRSAFEFLTGTALLVSLPAAYWIGPWPACVLLSCFLVMSHKSLRHCLRKKGPVFYAFAVALHAVYGAIVTCAGIYTLLEVKVLPRLKGGQ
jgi:glycosyltransferase involved in cell wall biosynthesis